VAITVSVTNCTSLKTNNGTQGAVSVFPNPGNGFFRLQLPVSGDYSITVLNAIGEIVVKDSFSGNDRPINLENVNRGIYFIIVESKDIRAVKKIIRE
jgi:hypothetical protein